MKKSEKGIILFVQKKRSSVLSRLMGKSLTVSTWLGLVGTSSICFYSAFAYGQSRSLESETNSAPLQKSALSARDSKISMQFDNIGVREALQVIAHNSRMNIVANDSVTGYMSLYLQQVTWQEALQTILEAKGLEAKQMGTIILIAPRAEIAEKERLSVQAQAAKEEASPLRTRSFRLNYAKAVDLERKIQSQSSTTNASFFPTLSLQGPQRESNPVAMDSSRKDGRLLSARGSIIAEERTNQIIVTDVADRLEAIAEVISLLDVPMRQVLIEAKIVEADSSWGRNLGVRLGGYLARAKGSSQQALSSNAGLGNSLVGLPGALGGSTGYSPLVDLPAAALNGYNPASIAFTIFNPVLSRLLNIELSALEAQGKGRIISSPRVVTADQHKASIEQGTELPYQVTDKDGKASIQFRKASLKLEVTPRITPEGNIVMDLDIHKDTVGRQTTSGYAVDTKRTQTQVIVENGGTASIAGIFEELEKSTQTQVPILGSIPILGALFRSTGSDKEKTELHIFVTPRMITSQGELR